jgi:hypothetical protein
MYINRGRGHTLSGSVSSICVMEIQTWVIKIQINL